MNTTANADCKYTLGFIFDRDARHVLLIHKLKPEWQAGRMNGVGGKLEAGESPVDCISRETREETGLMIGQQEWTVVGTIHQNTGDARVYGAVYPGEMQNAHSADYESVEWFETDKLPTNVIPNLCWLIPLTLQKLQDPGFKEFSTL